jgi:hypothetical protein
VFAVEGVAIEHVRLRRAQVELPVARLRLSHLFSSVALHPTAMPPSALLIVRSMSDPLPGRIARQFAAAPVASNAWESAAQSQLDALYRRAARPAHGPVPLSAEAVLFADYAELLVCLTLSWNVSMASAWWWKFILRTSVPQPSAWADVWAEHPQYVPSALRQLHAQGKALLVLAQMTPVQAWRLLLAVAEAFGLPVSALVSGGVRPAPVAAAPQWPVTKRSASPPGAAVPTHPDETERNVDHLYAWASPWELLAPASTIPIAFGVERHALLGLSLLLATTPHIPSSAVFALELRSWFAAERAKENPATSDVQSSVSSVQLMQVQLSSGEALKRKNDFAAPSLAEDDRVETAGSPPRATVAESLVASSSLDVASRAGAPSLETAISTKAQSELRLGNGSRTCLGGVFYLIQLLLRSDLLFFDIGLGGWALLDLLARCLLYPRWAEVSEDPVWQALALLDGREPGTDPGVAFEPQTLYEAPESWLRDLEPCRRYVRFRSGRMELWNPEGFLTLDVLQESPARLASDPPSPPVGWAQRRAWRHHAAVCVAGLTIAPPLRRFLHFLLPYARWRLRRALGEANLNEVLSRKGMLYVTHSHVDLAMTMDQISLPARLAGLDANPGWVPLLGRVIRFHFVDHQFSRGAGS